MEAPPAKLSPEEFGRFIKEHVISRYDKVEERLVCRSCGSVIQQITCYVSIHTSLFADQCAGFGEVKRFPLPYCPKCEGEPKTTSTCIHMPFAA